MDFLAIQPNLFDVIRCQYFPVDNRIGCLLRSLAVSWMIRTRHCSLVAYLKFSNLKFFHKNINRYNLQVIEIIASYHVAHVSILKYETTIMGTLTLSINVRIH